MRAYNVMKYCVAVLLADADVLDATLDVLDDEAFVVVWAADDVVVVVVAFTELVVELAALVAVAGIHWSEI